MRFLCGMILGSALTLCLLALLGRECPRPAAEWTFGPVSEQESD